MKRFTLLLLWIPTLLSVACDGFIMPQDGSFENETTKEDDTFKPEYDDYTSIAVSSQITSLQPMTGIVPWADSKYTKDWVTLEYSYMLYSDVCKEKDVFDWTPVENLLDDIASRGHQAVVRFRYTYVGKSCAVPAYIKERDDYEALTAKAEGRNTEYPDWRCEELQRFHMEFHRLFAQKYDEDPRLAFVETGFGHWAEYHVYDGKFIAGRTFPSKEFQSQFLSSMDGWFKSTPWMISIDAADDHYSPFVQEPGLLKNKFGNFDDSFMCEDHDGYNAESWAFFGEDRYKTAPFGGEFSYYSDYDQKHCLDKAGMYGRKFEDEAAKFHMTFIIGADQPKYQSDSRLKEAGMATGYRFKIDDYRIKEGVGAVVNISNVGVAPIYRDAYVAVDGKRGSYSLRNLMPGKNAWIQIDFPAISEKSVISIECDHLVPGQSIQFQADVK